MKLNKYFNLNENTNVKIISDNKFVDNIDLLYLDLFNDINLLQCLNKDLSNIKYIVIDNINHKNLYLHIINFLVNCKFKLINESQEDKNFKLCFRNRKIKKIAFHIYFFCERGTSTAIYDYAHYSETMLGYESIIISPLSQKLKNIREVYKKFNNRFKNLTYIDMFHMEQILKDEKCDILYVIKHGLNDGVYSKKIKTCIHCVFDMTQPHGDKYVGVSQQIANKYGKTLFVPHMVMKASDNKENLRESLGIPQNATVFGYHGGIDTFNIEFVKNVVKKISRLFSNIYFVFVNIPRFDKHNSRLIFLNKIIDLDEKNKFINTCDCCLEAQSLGQSFGLSLADFSVNNKPIITYGGIVLNDNYRKILGDKAMYYKNEKELIDLIIQFDKSKYENVDLNCYKSYEPEKVMTIFNEIFCK